MKPKLKLPPEPDLLGDALEENRRLRKDARRMRKAIIAYMRCNDFRSIQILAHEVILAVKQSQRTEES